MKELNKVNFNFNTDLLIGVGDLVDRGPESLRCLELLNKKWFKSVRGNHEQFIIEYYESDRVFKKESNARLHTLNGGSWFYALDEVLQAYCYKLVRDLPYILTTLIEGKLIGFVHGDLPSCSFNITKNNLHKPFLQSQLLWGRTKISNNDDTLIADIDKIYLGHTIVDEPVHLGNCSYIDTGSYYYNSITVIQLK
jgi:serine/threonine protein phosphatase 1